MIRRGLRDSGQIGSGDDAGTIPETLAARLVEAARSAPFTGNSGGGVPGYRRSSLCSRDVVGVIPAPGCQPVILPEIAVVGANNTAADPTLRRSLVRRLAVAPDLRINGQIAADLGWRNDTQLATPAGIVGRR